MRARLLSLIVLVLTGCEAVVTGEPFMGLNPGSTDPNNPIDPNDPTTPNEVDVCRPDLVDVGRVTIRRLNRAEYDNTMRDLLGVTNSPANDFPADDFGHGFDNQGDVLSTAPVLVEKYDAAALKLAQDTIAAAYTAGVLSRTAGGDLTASTGSESGNSGWNLYTNGTLTRSFTVTSAGQHTFRARAYETPAGTDRAKMAFIVDGQRQGALVDVAARQASPQTYSRQLNLTAGTHTIGVEFTNDFYEDPNDRNLIVEWFEVEAPARVRVAADARVFTCDPFSGAACVRTVVENFGRKAWRRPLTTAEVDKLVALVGIATANGDDVMKGLELALHATMLSPNFLFRVEADVNDTARPLDDHELAARLSYFLWASAPDAELLALADNGTLRAQLPAQVTRMLADPKSETLSTQFAGNWLWSRAVEEASPDPVLFATVNAALKHDMQKQTQEFFKTFYREDRSALELLTAEDTFMNDRLASHYGLPLPGSNELQRVAQVPELRRGLLGQAGFLTVTSQPTRTSPVKRGKWVLAQLLCMEPPPPPANVEAFAEAATPTGTLREQFEAHRSKPECKGCHQMMDPIGFGLENYDAVGRYRTEDNGGFAIDSSGELVDGRRFVGPSELSATLSHDPAFTQCMTRHLFTYALGRAPVNTDRCTLKQMNSAFEQSGYRLPALITALVTSDTFTSRRGETR
ncbi:MAG: DUF1592 domain-containing protein [Archangium sp.]